MKIKAPLALTLAAATAVALAPVAGGQSINNRCVVTFQPWDQRSYAAALLHPDGSIATVLEQGGELPQPVTVTIDPASVTAVLWAAKRLPADTVDDFFDVLHVTQSCDFAEAYHAQPGRQDSVIIGDAAPVTTMDSTPTTLDNPPATIVEQRITPLPQSTTTTALPSSPSLVGTAPVGPTTVTDPPPVTSALPTVELHTATSLTADILPVTGSNSLLLLWIGGLTTALGTLAVGMSMLRRRTTKENR